MIIPIAIGFGCGAISTFCLWMVCAMLHESSSYTADITIDVLSQENDRLVFHNEQLSQSLAETAQALRERDDENECLRRKAFYTYN
jgi:hypothetical protein